jgi:hypothetical protein
MKDRRETRDGSRARRPLVLVALLGLIAALLGGCGGGAISSLTGGGVPAGRAALEGTVADALDPGQPVADATVSVTVQPDAGGSAYTETTRTDSAGAFSFAGLPEGEATVQVTPPAAMPGRPLLAQVRVRGGYTASLAASIEPLGVVPAVASLTVSPESIDAVVGVPVEISATALLTNGRPIRPTWVVEGGIGRIGHGGHFLPLGVGSGQIRVRAGDQEKIIPVVVR